ncbi:MAG: DEAD/DEAH box helicase, partial [Myxococcales bacterium]|nr:DEAD/DEAH box helicase [Myxococcales bacterium]
MADSVTPESDAAAPAPEAAESDADAPAAEASQASAEPAEAQADVDASPEASADAAEADVDASPVEASPAPEATEASDDAAEPALPAEFDDFNLDPKLRSAITAMGWLRPTPVQSKAFGPLVRGGDLMVQSHTGSGKTGAFCLPWLAARFDPAPAKDTGVQLIVVLPTRELAKQVCVELGRLAAHLNIELLP